MSKIDNAEHCVCCGQVIPEGSQYCVICGHKAKHKKTNYDRIRNMSVEELAKLLDYTNDGDLFVDICAKEYCQEYNNQNLKCSGNCLLAITKYLESECDTE